MTRRIGILLGNLQRGGTEQQGSYLACSLKRAGHDVIVFVTEEKGPLENYLSDHGIPVVDLKLNSSRKGPGKLLRPIDYLKSSLRLLSVLKRKRIHILQSFLFWQNIFLPFIKLTHPSIQTISGRRNTRHPYLLSPVPRLLSCITNVFTDQIVVNSRSVASETFEKEWFAAHKLRVIPNFAPTDVTERESLSDPQARQFFEEHEPVFVYPANFKKQKRHDRFVHLLSELKAYYPQIGGVLIGRDLGTKRQTERSIRRAGLTDHILTLSSDAPVPLLLEKADALLFTSDHEGLPNVVMEAMKYHCLVIASDSPGTRDLIHNNHNGLLIDNRTVNNSIKRIVQLMGDKNKQSMLIENAIKSLDNYSQKNILLQWLELYKQLVARKSSR